MVLSCGVTHTHFFNILSVTINVTNISSVTKELPIRINVITLSSVTIELPLSNMLGLQSFLSSLTLTDFAERRSLQWQPLSQSDTRLLGAYTDLISPDTDRMQRSAAWYGEKIALLRCAEQEKSPNL